MAKTNTAERVRNTRNPFKGMTLAEMKKKYSSMTPAQRAANVQTFRDAAKSAPKSKPAAKAKPAKSKMGAAVLEMGGRNVKPVKKTGTHGEYRKKGDPGPAVRRKGSTTGASVDPRERSLRKNREDAKRSRRRGLKMNRRGRRVR